MNSKLKIKLTIKITILLFLACNMSAIFSAMKKAEEIHQQALDQADEIDLIIELLAEAANKGKFNQKNKKESLIRLNNMRNALNIIKNTNSNAPKILRVNEIIINSLEFMATYNFGNIPNIKNMILRNPAQALTTEETQEKLLLHEKKIENIQKTFKNIGLSRVNRAIKKLEKIVIKLNIHKAAYRLIPYALIILYITNIDRIRNNISFIPKIFGDVIFSIKKSLGIAPLVTQDTTSSTNQESNNDESQTQNNNQIISDKCEIGNLIKFEIGPVIQWAPAGFLLSLIKNDWADFSKIAKKYINATYLKLKNQTLDEDTIFSKPLLSSESLDVLEIPEFKNLKNSFKYKHLFNLAAHCVEKSYLLVGPLTDGFYIADILCGQLSKELNKDCQIIKLNASDFVPPKKLKDSTFDKEDKIASVLEDAKEQDLCIVVIDDIDWIYKQKERTIAKLDKFLEDSLKEDNMIVIGLTERVDEVGDSAKNKLIKIEIENPNYQQRVKFIKAQLRDDHAAQNMDIEIIAKQTETYTLADLKKIVKDAYTISYAEHKPFNKKHLAQSLAKMAKSKKMII